MENLINMLPSGDLLCITTSNKSKFKSFLTYILSMACLFRLVEIIQSVMTKPKIKNNGDGCENKQTTYSPQQHTCCACELLSCKEAPVWTIEPYVTEGYLPQGKPTKYYLRAVYTLNYELMNVWTNIIPLAGFGYLLYHFKQEVDLLKAWPLLVITLGSMIVMLFSSIAHIFHSKSESWHRNCFLLDYFGIMVYGSCSTTANWFASTTLSHYSFLKSHNLTVLMGQGYIGFLCMASTKMGLPLMRTPHWQRVIKVLSNCFGYLYGMLPVIYRMISGEIDPTVKFYHQLQFFFMMLNPVLFAADFPQKYWPGRFNVFFHSHQLFHVSVACSCLFHILAIHADVTLPHGAWSHLVTQADYPHLMDFTRSLVSMLLCCVLTVLCMSAARNTQRRKQV